MSSCLTGGGGRGYRLESLDLEMIKSPSTSSWISNSPSPSSTLSESSNSISTRKPRTPRKRPNQTYNEAAAILSTAYPKLFPTKHLTKFTSKSPFSFDPSSDLFVPFHLIDASGFLLHPPLTDRSSKGFSQSPGEINSSYEPCDDDFDAESILDEEVGEGIDSIMGSLGIENEPIHNSDSNCCYGYPVGYGMRRELRAFRNVDEGNWWRFPCVNVVDITPKIAPDKKNKGGVKINSSSEPAGDDSVPNSQPTKPGDDFPPGLLLKLNYDAVLNAWSDKASPFSGGDSDAAGNDVQARLAQIDLFSENGGVREASVLRYKEKRRTRLFSKKIRYQVRKVNADRRPRMKGRFVRTPNAPDDD